MLCNFHETNGKRRCIVQETTAQLYNMLTSHDACPLFLRIQFVGLKFMCQVQVIFNSEGFTIAQNTLGVCETFQNRYGHLQDLALVISIRLLKLEIYDHPIIYSSYKLNGRKAKTWIINKKKQSIPFWNMRSIKGNKQCVSLLHTLDLTCGHSNVFWAIREQALLSAPLLFLFFFKKTFGTSHWNH